MTTRAPEGVAIRRVERADLLDVFRIERASFPQPWPYQAFEGFVEEPGFLVAVGPAGGGGTADDRRASRVADLATAPEVVVGYVVADVVSELGRTIGHVKDLAVAPDWRGRGVGARLLERALAVLVTGGARHAKLEVRTDNHTARALYDRFGFQRNHVVPGYYEDGQDALVLVADLAAFERTGDR